MERIVNVEITESVIIEPSSLALDNMVREEYIEVEPNVRLHVTDAGAGKAIVLLHGWPLSDEMFEYQYADLINSGFRVIGITLRGFGKSDKPYSAYNYDVHAKDIKNILCKLQLTDVILGGFSMGGAIAIRYASADDGSHVSKLALFGAAAPSWTQREDYPYNMKVEEVDELITLCNKDRTQLLVNFGKIVASSETALSSGIADWLYSIGLSASSYATSQCLLALRDTDLRADLAKIKIPTLIMHGKKDKICSFSMAEQMNDALEHSYLVEFEHSGHALFLEETTKFNEELIKFATSAWIKNEATT
jgi:non-heme chloroperoxidase